MIAYLEGDVLYGGDGFAVVRTGGIGYRVFPVGFVPLPGSTIAVHVYHHIREDREELYGFESRDLMQWFEQLIDISGVGPRLAQKILAPGDAAAFQRSILQGELGYFTAISGVGKKTAQKIILELKGVLVTAEEEAPLDQDTLEALLSLGYDRRDATEVIPQLTGETPEDRIREALRLLTPNS